MKRFISGILTVAMLASAGSVFAVDFTDTKGHWAESAINELAAKGIVDGFSDTEFLPDDEVSRAQYLKMIMEATGMQTTPYRVGECLEAKESNWYSPYLQKALDCGLVPASMIAGYKQSVVYEVDENGNAISSKLINTGAFNGDLPISREEMAVLTMTIYQYTRTVLTNAQTDVSAFEQFKDNDNISEWASNSVKTAVINGFIEGDEYNNFNPKDTTTRAQAATVIKRVLDKESK